MGSPSLSIPYTPHREAPRWVPAKRAGQRVAGDRVLLRGNLRSVGTNSKGLILSPSPEGSGMIRAHCNLELQDSSYHPDSTSQIAETTGINESHYVDQAGFKLLASSDPPASSSQISDNPFPTYKFLGRQWNAEFQRQLPL
ncbi:hypothetical protein AAY473_000714 [Plecturocebus cupreus]